jgi:hypothetical protein
MMAVLGIVLAGRWRSVLMPPIWVMVLALLFIAVMGFDGFNALLTDLRLPHPYQPDNRLRLITGALSGLGIALLVMPIINFALWRNGARSAVVGGWRGLLGLLGLEAVFVAVVLTGWSPLLYPISTFSVAGVALLLFVVNLILLLGILRRESQANGWLDLLGPASVAATLATIQLLVLAGLRYWAEATLGITPL